MVTVMTLLSHDDAIKWKCMGWLGWCDIRGRERICYGYKHDDKLGGELKVDAVDHVDNFDAVDTVNVLRSL